MRSMGNRNHEGYRDPTASQAIRRVKRQGKAAENPASCISGWRGCGLLRNTSKKY